jgi:hypothetical protein
MQAFPKDSLNNVLGGGGPLNKRPDHSTFLGNHDEEAFNDFSTGREQSNSVVRPEPLRKESGVIDPRSREEVHGDESLGLGTSTFLDGAPASRAAIQRRETDSAVPQVDGGLQRKKSLAQKIRGISNNRREYHPSGRITSPEAAYDQALGSPNSPYGASGSKRTEKNPFFNEYDTSEKKGESITIVEPLDKPGRARAPSSPKGYPPTLERRTTTEGFEQPQSKSSGFLSRVKSLKGGPRKPREPKPLV